MHYFTIIFAPALCSLAALTASAQDSVLTQQLPAVTIDAYFSKKPRLTSPASIDVIDNVQLANHPAQSLVGAVNTAAGVRMEERSPGSYRLSIRGSVLRSPFGVRNVKIYVAGLGLTDAGGNTYINLLDAGTVSGIEILKGPEGSIYGANTGGVVLINPVANSGDSLVANAMIQAGSYGYLQARVFFQVVRKKYLLNVSQSFAKTDGYRQNSATRQWTSQVMQQWQYIPRARLQAYLLFTHLNYQTPGGLTLSDYEHNPRLARPATATLPGAVQQKAAIYNTTVFGGITHQVYLTPNVMHFISVAAGYTDFKNPFITNYEARTETNINARTYIEWQGKRQAPVVWNWTNGAEVQQFFSGIGNYDNNGGLKGVVQARYLFNAGTYFGFTHFNFTVLRRLTVEAALSLNYNRYTYRNRLQSEHLPRAINFKPQLMPRLAVSVKIAEPLVWRASVSRGYSAPTLAEVHPSANIISTGLQPESGWNYETGLRLQEPHGILWLDVSAYFFNLQNAIVIRNDTLGNAYFVNAGQTHNTGIDAGISIWLVKPRTKTFVRALQLNGSYTFAYYRFHHYSTGGSNYSGNLITGVPPHTAVANLLFRMPLGFYVFSEYSYTAHLPLNDANSAFAKYYNLVQLKAGWQFNIKGAQLEVFAGVANLLNTKYSLGNDLNAAGNRYYNAAMPRNYYAGLLVGYRQPKNNSL